VSDLVWYAAYGSNLSRERFSCYLQGGTPTGAARTYTGCRDPAPARGTGALGLRGRLTFGGESTVWGGGLAFLDPAAQGEVVARSYLVTTEQLDEVFELERRYDVRLRVGERNGIPVVAFTSTARHEVAAPSAAYLRTLLHGLTDGLLELDAAVDYLLGAPGVDLGWNAEGIRALAERVRPDPRMPHQ
jgi:hypothetical protein